MHASTSNSLLHNHSELWEYIVIIPVQPTFISIPNYSIKSILLHASAQQEEQHEIKCLQELQKQAVQKELHQPNEHHVGIGPSNPIDRIQHPVVHFQHDLYFRFQWQTMGMGAGNRCATRAWEINKTRRRRPNLTLLVLYWLSCTFDSKTCTWTTPVGSPGGTIVGTPPSWTAALCIRSKHSIEPTHVPTIHNTVFDTP